MFKVFKLKPILIMVSTLLISVLLSIGIVSVVQNDNIPKITYTIVLDAGHGGRDAGCSGLDTDVKESDINLAIVKKLKSFLENMGINVELTRHDQNGLYASNVENYKLSDMSKRMDIIEKASPEMVISIHQNSYSDRAQRGAQAFYQEGDESGKVFAEAIQSELISQLENAREEANFGDYYILDECKSNCVIVECGYLTNPDEEKLLSSDEYQDKVAYAIMCGVVRYFGLCGND